MTGHYTLCGGPPNQFARRIFPARGSHGPQLDIFAVQCTLHCKVRAGRRMKDLEEENARLKRIVANMTLEIDAIKHVLEKKFGGLTTNGKQ